MRLLVALVAATVAAQPAGAQARVADTTMLVTTTWLALHRHDPGVVVLDVAARAADYAAGHIPGAHLLLADAMTVDIGGVSAELPSLDSLRELFESVGISNTSHVVLSGPPLNVARAFFTLDYMGLEHVAALDGGLAQWKAEGRSVETSTGTVVRGHLIVHARPAVVASSEWVLDHLGKPGVVLLDARRQDEFVGAPSASSEGHLPGARHLEWQELFRDATAFTPRESAQLAALIAALPGDTIVAYCRVGHRGSAVYFAARLLGFPVKLYDGSYQEWSQRGLPLVRGP